MNKDIVRSPRHAARPWRVFFAALLAVAFILGLGGLAPRQQALAQQAGAPPPDPEARFWYEDAEIEAGWRPDYLRLATGAPGGLALLPAQYEWPVATGTPFTIGHVIQSYQFYGGTPYFHHGTDIMAADGTQVFSRSGGQVINVARYSTMYLYWEVAVLDPDGYIWVYHHIERRSIPRLIWDKFAEYRPTRWTAGSSLPIRTLATSSSGRTRLFTKGASTTST